MTPVFWRRVRDWLPELLLLAVTTFAGLWARGRWVDPMGDAGTWWSAIYRLANGDLLYRDVFLQFGPLSPYVLALGARIFGPTALYLAIAGWLVAVGAAFLLVRVARHFMSTFERVGLVGLVLALGVFAPGPGRLVFAYAPGAVHALLLSLASISFVRTERPTQPVRAYFAGLLAGLAFSAKQEIGLACLAALGAADLLQEGGLRRGWIARILAGFSVPAALSSLLVLASAPFESLREESRVWPIAPAPPDSWLHLYRVAAGISSEWHVVVLDSLFILLWYVALVAVAGLLMARERSLLRWRLPGVLLVATAIYWAANGFEFRSDFHPVSLSMVISFFVAGVALVHPSAPERPLLVALGTFAGLLGIRTAASPQLSGHYSGIGHFTAALTWGVFLCVVMPLMLGGKAAVSMRRLMALALLFASWPGAFGSIRALASDSRQEVETRQGKIFVAPDVAKVFQAIGRRVSAGESVWVLPEINGVDALFQADNVSPYPSHMPGWLGPKEEMQLLTRIAAAPPQTVAIFSRETNEYGVRPLGEGYGQVLGDWIFRNYVPVESMRAGSVMKPRSRESLR